MDNVSSVGLRNAYRTGAVSLIVLAAAGVAIWALSEHQEEDHRAHAVRPGLLYRSRQPRAEDFPGLQRRRITRIVNLCTESEDPQAFADEAATCSAYGMRMIHIPIGTDFPRDDQIERFLRELNQPDGATLVHCAHGRSRTGIMVAAFRVVIDAWPIRRAFAEMLRYGYRPSDADGDNGTLALLERLSRQRAEWLERIKARATQPQNRRGAPEAARSISSAGAPEAWKRIAPLPPPSARGACLFPR